MMKTKILPMRVSILPGNNEISSMVKRGGWEEIPPPRTSLS
jgi:hypothetical protein